MSFWQAWRERLDDAINPIVVKELRQAVHGNFLVALLIGFPLILLLAMGAFLLSGIGARASYDQSQGQLVFLTLQGLLLFVCMFVVPFYTAVRLASERSGDNLDLLFVTTLKPRAIIAGKLLAGMVLVLLLYSACLPFLAFTYFLRGIDLPSILVVVAAGLGVILCSMVAAIFLVCLLQHRVLRALATLVWFSQLFTTFIFVQTMLSWMISSGIGSRLGDAEFWGWTALVICAGALVLALLFQLSVALISPPSSNRARPVRLFLTACWLPSLGVAVAASWLLSASEPMEVWLQAMAWVLGLGALVVVSAPDQPSYRVLREVPARGLGRVWAFLTSSSAAGGLCWVLLMVLATAAAGLGVGELVPVSGGSIFHGSGKPNGIQVGTFVASSFVLYLVAYSVTAQLLLRALRLKRFPPKVTWAMAILLLCAGSLLPVLVFLLLGATGRLEWALLLNPFAAFDEDVRDLAVLLSGGWVAVVLALNGSWLLSRWRSFRPPAEPPALPAEGAVAAATGPGHG